MSARRTCMPKSSYRYGDFGIFAGNPGDRSPRAVFALLSRDVGKMARGIWTGPAPRMPTNAHSIVGCPVTPLRFAARPLPSHIAMLLRPLRE
jgi:hypothetical protein